MQTFATTVNTKVKNTVSIDPEVLATSNGESGKQRLGHHGGTSFGSGTSGAMVLVAPGAVALLSMFAGMGMMMRMSR